MPMYRTGIASIILCAVAMSGCASAPRGGSHLLTPEPPREQALRSELKRELSSLTITVEATAAELAENVNRLTPKALYKGSTKTRGLSADVNRTGAITVRAADNHLYVGIPVAIKLNYGPFETPAITTKLTFRLSARMTPDWRMVADVAYTGLNDLLLEEAGIGPLSIKPRSIVEGLIQPVQRSLSEVVTRKLNEGVTLRSEVQKAWTAAQKPIQLDRGYNAWLRITPAEVLLYPLEAKNNVLRLSAGLTSHAELVVGPEPPAAKPVPLPKLKLVNSGDRGFRVALNSELYYRDIVAIAAPHLIGKQLGSDGRSVILRELELYGNGDRLVIRVVSSGDLEGTIYLTARPLFDPRTNRFSVEDVDFDMQTQSMLLQSADWFLHGTIRERIREKLNLDLGERLNQARELAGKALTRVKLADGVFLDGSITAIRLNDVLVRRDRLAIQVFAEGTAAIAFH